MLRHRKEANAIRERLGRGRFRYGPKVTDLTIDKYEFNLICRLEEKDSDDESDDPITPTTATALNEIQNDSVATRQAVDGGMLSFSTKIPRPSS